MRSSASFVSFVRSLWIQRHAPVQLSPIAAVCALSAASVTVGVCMLSATNLWHSGTRDRLIDQARTEAAIPRLYDRHLELADDVKERNAALGRMLAETRTKSLATKLDDAGEALWKFHTCPKRDGE